MLKLSNIYKNSNTPNTWFYFCWFHSILECNFILISSGFLVYVYFLTLFNLVYDLTTSFCFAGGVMLCLQIAQELRFFTSSQQTPTGNSEFYHEKVYFLSFSALPAFWNSYCVALFGAFVLGVGFKLLNGSYIPIL